MEDHGGRIDVTSDIGVGTTFRLCFPCVKAAPATTEGIRPASDAPKGQGQDILVVDDDVMQLRIAERMLTQLGYKVRTAESGEKAVEMIGVTPPDLVLLDMQMSGIDGAETMRQMRRIVPDQRALIVSGYAGTERVSAALAAGALGFVQKPLQIASLANAVHRALSTARPQTVRSQ